MGKLERSQIRQWVRLGPGEFRSDNNDGEPRLESERGQNRLGVGARRVGDDGALQISTVGKVKESGRPGDGFDASEVGAVEGLFLVESGALALGRQVGQEYLANSFVGDAVNALVVERLLHRDAMRRENPLESRHVPCIAVDQGPVQIEEKRSSRRHIVAPICQGVNSASP